MALTARRHLTLALSLISILASFICIHGRSLAEEVPIVPKRFLPAVALSDKGDCAGAWQYVWNSAKRGDVDALAVIYFVMTMHIEPPGGASSNEIDKASRLDMAKHRLALIIYASSSTETFGFPNGNGPLASLPTVIIHLTQSLNLGEAGREVAACYGQSSEHARCVKFARSLNMIPPFEIFVRDEEGIVKRYGGSSCS